MCLITGYFPALHANKSLRLKINRKESLLPIDLFLGQIMSLYFQTVEIEVNVFLSLLSLDCLQLKAIPTGTFWGDIFCSLSKFVNE